MKLRLHSLNTPEREAWHTLDPPGGFAGRSLDSAIHLPYDSVSRQHIELRHDGTDWWVHNLSQTSPTFVDEQVVTSGQSKKLGPSGALKLGRILFEYHQEGAAPERADAMHLAAAATLVPPHASIAVPPRVLSQMSPVRATEVPLAAPPTLVRRPNVPTPAPPPIDNEGPPTIIRSNRPPSMPPPIAQAEPPPTIVRRPPGPVRAPITTASAQPRLTSQESLAPLAIEHQQPQASVVTELVPLAQLAEEREKHRLERERLSAEIAHLKTENTTLCDAKAALVAQLSALQAAHLPQLSSETPRNASNSENANVNTPLQEKALELLQPFSRSLEQAGEALRQGDVAQARTLLRGASFALADLRDLFQS